MKSIRVIVQGLRLAPADPAGQEILDGLKPGKVYKVDIKEDRSKGELSLYWASIGLLVSNYAGPQGGVVRINGRRYNPAKLWPTSRAYHNMLMRATGHMTRHYFIDRKRPGGIGWTEEVDSIALEAMEDEAFRAFVELAVAITVEIFGWDPFARWKELHPLPVNPESWKRNYRPGDQD